MHWRWFSSTESLLASKRTEFQPSPARADHVPLGAVSRCSATGPARPSCRRATSRTSRPGRHLHVLGRCLDDDRARSSSARRGRLHREVVDDVDGGDAVPAGERAVENLLGRHDWHASTSFLVGRAMLDTLDWQAQAARMDRPITSLTDGHEVARDPRLHAVRRGEVQDGIGVAFVDHEHVDDAGAEHAADREWLLNLADHGDTSRCGAAARSRARSAGPGEGRMTPR